MLILPSTSRNFGVGFSCLALKRFAEQLYKSEMQCEIDTLFHVL